MKKINLFLLLALLIEMFHPGQQVNAAAPKVEETEARNIDESMLNPDGTLRLDGSFAGSLDLDGWDVQMDPQRGPVFSPSQPAPAAVASGNWESLGSGGFLSGSLSSAVLAIAVSGSDVYVGGWFTDVNNFGTVIPEADYIAKWNGSNWSPLGTNGAGDGSLNDVVNDIVIRGSEIYVGGAFTDVNNYGTAIPEADYIAKYDTNTAQWSELGNDGSSNGSLNLNVYAMAIAGDDLYVGGGFTNVKNYGTVIPEADFIARFDLITGQWNPLGDNGAGDGALNGSVYDLAIKDFYDGFRYIYVGGNFTNVNNMGYADYIAYFSESPFGDGWLALGNNGAGDGSLNGNVYALAFSEATDTLYVGGAFTNVDNYGTILNAADYIAQWSVNGSAWSSLWVDLFGDGVLNGPVLAIATIGDIAYVGGAFTDVDAGGANFTADYIARWDGNWYALGSDGAGNGSLNSAIAAIAITGDTLYAGGTFSMVNSNGVLLPQAAYVAAYGANNPPIVESVARLDATPTANAYVDYLVTFSEPVYNASASDFTVDMDNITGAAVSAVSGADGTSSRTVTVFTGSGNGFLRLDVEDSVFITDSNGNFLGGWLGDGSFRHGEIYTIDKTAPTVSMSSAASDPTNASPIAVTVTFSESVTGFTSGDIVAGNSAVSNFAGSGASYAFDLTPAGQGLVTANIAAGAAFDSAGNGNTIAAQLSRTYDSVAPTVVITSLASNPTNASPIPVIVTFSESVTGFTSGDIIAGNGTVSNFAGSGASYTFDLTPAGQGLVTADIAAGTASDSAGNGNTIAAQFSRMFTVVYNLFLPLILR
jgi:hypothetical protein